MLAPSLCPSCFDPIAQPAPCPLCGYDPVKAVASETLSPGVELSKRYMVGGLLGQGGFGATYRGYDVRLASVVAIKEYFPFGRAKRCADGVSISVATDIQESFEFGRAKFLDEAKMLAKLRSIQKVVSVLDFFTENNTAYIVMEFLSGLTLTQFHSKHKDKRVPPHMVDPLFVDILGALSDIHEHKVLHRDISPDNILIDGKGGIKLLDFGAARQALSSKDQRMTVILKPGYAPYEQYSDISDHGPWSDIYSTGATFYTLLSGVKPIDSLKRVMDDTLQPLSALGVKIAPRAEKAILKALAVHPKNRWQSAAEFADELTGRSSSASNQIRQHVEVQQAISAKATASSKLAAVQPGIVKATPIKRDNQNHTKTVEINEQVGQAISTVELKCRLGEHARFLAGKPNGKRINLSLRCLSGVSLVGVDLSQAELTGTTFSQCDLSSVNFTGANLFCANFTGVKLNNARFDKCDLRGAHFDGAELNGASFEGADCREGIMLVQRKDGQLWNVNDANKKRAASFVNAKMAGAVLRNASFGSAKFANASLENADFGGADLEGADLAGAVLKNAKFEKANLQDCDFDGADLEGVNTDAEEFNGAKLVRQLHEIDKDLQRKIAEHQKWVDSLSHSGKRLVIKNGDLSGLQMVNVDWSAAELMSSNLTDINLKQAKISMTDFKGSILNGAILFSADARGAKFKSCTIQGADFTGATLTPVVSEQGQRWCTTFAKSDLSGSNFQTSDCESADFRGANLRNANFTNTNLKEANFTGAVVDGANFSNAIMDGAIGLAAV